jgi:adenylosuccinate lyase
MTQIWSEESKLGTWLEVEIAVCQAQCQLGLIPDSALENIKKKASFDLSAVKEIEAEVKHDVVAFLTNVAQYVGDDARYIHMGMTSSDVLDTALALMLKRAGKLLSRDLELLHDAILTKAREHKHTIQIGRSHGIHAEPITFGFKLAVWLEEIRRHQARLNQAIKIISVGKISGPVGTYSNISPQVEAIALKLLDLEPDSISTQVVQRDRHAEFLWVLAAIGTSLDKFAIEIRNLQRTDVLEVEEPFTKGQKGSSAMPHKRNPVGCENISGLARILRANSLCALENIPLWHERDISHSSVERVIIPDSTVLTDYMLVRFTGIIKDLVVYEENMRRNADIYGGVIFSQAVLLRLVEKGLSREEAYQIVQAHAMKAWNQDDGNFKESLLNDKEILNHLAKEEIEICFDPNHYLNNIETVFERLGI